MTRKPSLAGGVKLGTLGALALTLGMVGIGCEKKKAEPEVVAPSPEQVAEREAVKLLADARAAYDAGDLDKAEDVLRRAGEKKANLAGLSDLGKMIAEKRKLEKAAKTQARVDEAQALLDAQDYDRAIASAEGILADAPENAAAGNIKAAAAQKKAEVMKSGLAHQYKDFSAKIDEALNARKWQEVIALAGELENLAGQGAGPSRKDVVAKAKAGMLEDDANRLRAAGDLRGALAKYRQAVQLNATPDMQKAVAEIERTIAQEQDRQKYNAAMQKAKQAFDAKNYQAAVEAYGEAMRSAGTARDLVVPAQEGMRAADNNLQYGKLVSSGKDAFARGDFAKARDDFNKAQRRLNTEEIGSLQAQAEARYTEDLGDRAAGEGDWARALTRYEDANATLPSDRVAGKIENARLKKDEGDYDGIVARAEQLREEGRMREAAPMLKDLAAKFPARGEAAALLARGATDEEKARLNEAAAPVWEELDARLAGLGTSEDRIAAIVEAMPGLALSDYEAKAQGRYSEERTAQLRPVWDDLRGQADAMEDLSARVAFFQEHRGQFEGTGIVKELDAAVVKANNSRLSGMYKQVLAQAKGLGGQEKVDYLAGQIANFSNSMYEQNIRTMLASEKSVLARSAYTQLMKDVRAAEQYGLKKNLIDNALADPMFQDTNFMAQIEKLRDTTKASEAKLSFVALRRIVGRELDAGRKVALLEAALADELIAGSAHEGAVQTMLQKAMQDKKESDAKVALGEVKAQLNQKPQTAEEYDENIARLTAIAQTVAGTKAMAEYDKIVDGQRKGKAALPEVGGEE